MPLLAERSSHSTPRPFYFAGRAERQKIRPGLSLPDGRQETGYPLAVGRRFCAVSATKRVTRQTSDEEVRWSRERLPRVIRIEVHLRVSSPPPE